MATIAIMPRPRRMASGENSGIWVVAAGRTGSGILAQWIIPAFGHILAGGFVEAGDVGVQPEDIEAAAGLELPAGADVVAEDPAVPRGPGGARAVVRQIHTGGAGKEHVRIRGPVAVFEPGVDR